MNQVKRAALIAAFSLLGFAASIAWASPTNLVTNGDFETGSLSDWNESGAPGTGVDPVALHTGGFGVLAAAAGSLGFIDQTLATTFGASYIINIWVANINGPGDTPNELRVDWGANIGVIDLVNLGFSEYTLYSAEVTAAGSSTILTIGSRNDPSSLFFDDISVTEEQVPEPASLALFGISLAGLRYARRRKIST